MNPEIDIEGYCVDCNSYHSCITCSRMNQHMSDLVNGYREALINVVEVNGEDANMTPEEIVQENKIFKISRDKERRVY